MRVLLVVPPERTDYYSYLAKGEGIDFSLLWHARREDDLVDHSRLPLPFSERFYWRDYASPEVLLAAVRPDKIVFFEIIDLNQIALVVAARAAGIRTFYLEHGAAGDSASAIELWQSAGFVQYKLRYLIQRLLLRSGEAVASKLFYYRQRQGFECRRSRWLYRFLPLAMPFAIPNKVLARNLFRERVPDLSIVFNRANYEHYRLYTGIEADEALLTGVPAYDTFFRAALPEAEHIVFVEHPYLEDGFLGWSEGHHERIARHLHEVAEQSGRKVYIKLHPRSSMDRWARYGLGPNKVELIQEGDFTDLYLSAKLIISYSSSLLVGLLCARKNVVLVGWHPQPQIFGRDFSATGICHKSFDTADLQTKLDAWLCENKAEQNPDLYEAYLLETNYPFDGRAAERVIEAIRTL